MIPVLPGQPSKRADSVIPASRHVRQRESARSSPRVRDFVPASPGCGGGPRPGRSPHRRRPGPPPPPPPPPAPRGPAPPPPPPPPPPRPPGRAPPPPPPGAAAPGERVALPRAQRRAPNALGRLAALDGVRRPAGELMLAEVDGDILAAVPVEGGPAIADPF